MDENQYLQIADMRLLQTWHLLRRLMREHPDHDQINRAADAIHDARDILANLRSR